jgi:hypothetical protein
MVHFKTQNPNFWEPCNGKYWYSLWPFGIFDSHLVYLYYCQLVHFVVIWYIFPVYQEKSGNPEPVVGKTISGSPRSQCHWSPGGVAQWSPRLPSEQRTVRSMPDQRVYVQNVVLLNGTKFLPFCNFEENRCLKFRVLKVAESFNCTVDVSCGRRIGSLGQCCSHSRRGN